MTKFSQEFRFCLVIIDPGSREEIKLYLRENAPYPAIGEVDLAFLFRVNACLDPAVIVHLHGLGRNPFGQVIALLHIQNLQSNFLVCIAAYNSSAIVGYETLLDGHDIIGSKQVRHIPRLNLSSHSAIL